jgi:hypothetical protein
MLRSCAFKFKFIAAVLHRFSSFFLPLHSNMGIDGFACDVFIPAAVHYKRFTSIRSSQSHLLHRDLPKRGGARKQPQPTGHGASPTGTTAPHHSCPRRRHDAAAAFLAARRLLRLPPAGGPRTILSFLFSTSDAASALPLLSRWKTGWPRSNIRSRRRARRRGRQRQRQRRANPSRRRSRTP